MLSGWPKLKRSRGNLDGYPVRQNSNSNLSGWPDISRRLDLSHPLAQGLVGWWPIDEMQGARIRDLSIYRNHGALTNAADPPTATSGWGAGPSQRELALDGSNDYVNVPDAPSLSITGNITLHIIANLTSVGGARSFFGKRTGAGAANYLLWANGSTLSYFDGGVQSSTYTIVAGVPFVCTTVKIGTSLLWYLNGVYSSTSTVTDPAPTNSAAMMIGRDSSGQYTAVLPKHCRLYNRALSAAEIAQLYADKWVGSIGGIT